MMTRRKSKMEENIEAYRSTHPTYKQFCEKQNVWPVCSEFSIYNSIIFLEYLREIFTRKQQCSSVESSLSSVEIFFLNFTTHHYSNYPILMLWMIWNIAVKKKKNSS